MNASQRAATQHADQLAARIFADCHPAEPCRECKLLAVDVAALRVEAAGVAGPDDDLAAP